jgi:hypothetical protein
LDFFALVCCHAAHAGHPEEAQRQWWATLDAKISEVTQAKYLFIMADANAHLGEFGDSSVGTFCPEKENFLGKLFQVQMQWPTHLVFFVYSSTKLIFLMNSFLD